MHVSPLGSDSPSARNVPEGEEPLWQTSDIEYSWSDKLLSIDLNLYDEQHPNATAEGAKVVNSNVWRRLRQGKDVYLHVFLSGISDFGREEWYSLHNAVPLVKAEAKKEKKAKRFLLTGITPPGPDVLEKGGMVFLWKPEVAVRLVTDFTRYPMNLPQQIANKLEILELERTNNERNFGYKPPLHVDEIGLTSDKYVSVNSTVDFLPLKISFSPMSLQRWLLMQVLEQSLGTQQGCGLDVSDIDDMRRLITDTNIYLLAITIFASTLHLLFEFLAFKSDINFWKNNKSLRGLSIRSVVIELVTQTIILLYLIDTDSSLLLTVPGAVGILIQVWKVKKATGAELVKVGGFYKIVLTRLVEKEKGSEINSPPAEERTNGAVVAAEKKKSKYSDQESLKETLDLDRNAILHLSIILLPLCTGFSLRSLIMEQHAGWYSWALGSLTSSVYTMGFILMTPQLYINYKLKSVSHLPWRFLCYRFLNTFIDDLFAFIIRMPTMHRISCFRDDIVFIVYLYQRWIYPVDASRAMDGEDCGGRE